MHKVKVSEKRKYKRCSNIICKVLLSTDRKQWNEIDVVDISAGGIKFISYEDLTDKELVFDIHINKLLSEFNLTFEGKVVRKDEFQDNVYAVKFTKFNKYSRIQLDEVIKSKISVAKHNLLNSNHYDGVYAYNLVPRVRPIRAHAYRK